MSASAFSLSAVFAADDFRVVEGDPVLGGMRGAEQHHYFCQSCKTWLYTKIVGVDFLVNVRSSLFEDRSWVEPFVETMTREKQPWVTLHAKRQFLGFPHIEEYQALMDAYSTEVSRTK